MDDARARVRAPARTNRTPALVAKGVGGAVEGKDAAGNARGVRRRHAHCAARVQDGEQLKGLGARLGQAGGWAGTC